MLSYARNGDVRIRFVDTGLGEPVLLAHGLSDALESWEENGWLGELRASNRVILADLRGHGRSDKPHDPEAYGTRERAGDIVAVLDRVEVDRVHWLGASLGGWTGFCMAKHAPERLRSLAVGGVPIRGQSLELYRRALESGLPSWIALLERSLGILPPAARARLLANDPIALAAAVARDRPSMVDPVRRLGVPVMFYAGALDPLRDEIAADAEAVPGASFIELPGLDHLQATCRPAVLPRYLDFLRRAGRKARA